MNKIAIKKNASLVSDRLLAIYRGRDAADPVGKLPWPLTKEEIFLFEKLDIAFMEITGISDKNVMDELVSKNRERFSAIGYSEYIVYPSIPGVLSKLKQLGMALGVCTSKRADFADKILKMFKLIEYFDFVSGGDVGISKSEQLGGLIANRKIKNGDIMIER